MPFKSKAQRRKFAELLVKGEISEETYEEWNRSTGKAQLPERVHPKSRRKAKKAKRATRSRKAAGRGPKGRSGKVARAKARPRAKAKGKRRAPT
jgi:hypothetical protein